MVKTIYMAGGCFWGMQKLMKSVPGVVNTTAGYANGTSEDDANYDKVCSGRTGFRETVRVDYHPDKISLTTLLLIFFYVIDPEAVNRQGNDTGSQYQAGIYYEENDAEAEQAVLNTVKIQVERYENFAVEIRPLKNFFAAEEYHQDYLDKNPGGYCHISPKVIDDFSKMKTDPGRYSVPGDDILRDMLTKEQYHVVRQNGTEPPFSNEFWDFDGPGIYVDAASGEPLFTSKDKFASSCGWPAFAKPIDRFAVFRKEDKSFGMVRTEVRSMSGDSHLGHVFDGESESPTGVRYCINSAALRFVPFDNMKEEGYESLMGEVK